MSLPTFSQFLNIARRHVNLIIDLCAEQDIISRAKLLSYMERYDVPAAEKDALIEDLSQALVLHKQEENSYIVNQVVVDVVNYYERRGRLTNASFLRDQIVEISRLTDELQKLLFAESRDREAILDRIDDLYRLVREVREAGDSHYVACMRLFGDLKRDSDHKTIEQRLDELETIQRRHINPLRELIDPNAEYAHKITALKRRIGDMRSHPELLAQSQELTVRQQRLSLDLHYIEHNLLRNFEKIADTARTLLQSLLEEKNIKEAIAGCLGNLDAVWTTLSASGQTMVAAGRQSTQSPTADMIESFFAEVVHLKLLPNPTPLIASVQQSEPVEALLIRDEQIWHLIRTAGHISSWPAFVVSKFNSYSDKEQLRALALPLIVPRGGVQVASSDTTFSYKLAEFNLQLKDFAVSWKDENGRSGSPQKSGNLPQAVERLSV